ncbi:MAG: sensor histidine kinase [Bacillota bacterium]
MTGRLKHIVKEDKKYFFLFSLLLLIIFILGIISPVLVEKKRQNWESELKAITTTIDGSVQSKISDMESEILRLKSEVKSEVGKVLSQNKVPNGNLFDLLNKQNYAGNSIEIYDNSREMIAWTPETAPSGSRLLQLDYQPGEIHFCRTGLQTYLCVIDTLNISGGGDYFLSVSIPVEKYYKLQNNYFRNVSLSEELSQKFMTSFEIEYSPSAEFTKDGRKHSTEVKSNYGNRIAVITFSKPSRDTNLANLKEIFIDFQSVLAIISIICLALGLRKNLKKIRQRTLRFAAVFLFFAVLRALLFLLDIPSRFIEGPLTDASNFASAFGFGIVKSPLEFSVTIIIALLVCLYLFENVYKYVKTNNRKSPNNIIKILAVLFGAAFYLIELRGVGASLKSIIFDSSLRYFKEPGLLPNLASGLMQLNFLVLGLSSVMVSVSVILFIFSLVAKERKSLKSEFFTVFAIFQILGIIYDLTQSEPQGTPLIRIIYITLTFIAAYKIQFEERRNLFNYIYFTLISSIITISLLNYYNTQLEKESLKTTAFELTRTNDDWLEYLIREALFNASTSPETIRALKSQQTDYESAAFLIWSQSTLQREEISSSITFLDRQKAFLGSFGINIDPKYRISPEVLDYQGEELQIFNNYRPAALQGKIVSGIVPVKEDNVLLGYVAATVLFDPERVRVENLPGFLQSKQNKYNTAVNFDKLKVFVFTDNLLTNVYGDIIPADWHIENIIHADLSETNDTWINLNINKENYITYILRESENNSSKIIAVSLKEKNLSWSLYNFFKVFFIHSIFIISLLAFIFLFQLKGKNKEFRYTFRTQLLAAFLLIALLPMIFLAFYNRTLTEEKNRDTILFKLKQNASDIENYLKEHLLGNPSLSLRLLATDANRDLNIEFALYNDKELFYSSKEEFYSAGIIPPILNPFVYDRLKHQGFKEYVTEEKIENYPFISFASKIELGGKEYILKVNDIFNKIPLPVTSEEVDIFLFGSYFFATILVIIFSTVLANRISSPIRSLTKATASVASGDFGFEVNNNQKGEIRDLISGFNLMIKELKRSQAELAEMERETAWKEMARQVAHEIKNPLTPMKLAVQQLIIAYKDKSPKLDMIFDKVSQTIISQIETLNNIASEFSAFARMPKIVVEHMELNSVVEDACNLFIEENIRIETERDSERYLIEADKDQLKRTIINLIRNSMQAGADTVKINIYKKGSKINLEVNDNGRGILQEHQGRVFEENFTTKEKGMGLGLKLAKKFMESIKGNISVAETSPRGTKILLEFPYK